MSVGRESVTLVGHKCFDQCSMRISFIIVDIWHYWRITIVIKARTSYKASNGTSRVLTLLNCKSFRMKCGLVSRNIPWLFFFASQAPLGSLAYFAVPFPIDVISTLSYLAHKHAAHTIIAIYCNVQWQTIDGTSSFCIWECCHLI